MNTGILSFKRDKYKLLFIAKEQDACEDLQSTPLAVSHMVGGKINKRYDYILMSPHWEVLDVDYRYEETIKHVGDHALVVADLRLSNQLD